MRGADEPALGGAPQDVAQPHVARQLRLSERMDDRQGFELLVAQRHVGAVELLEVHVLGAPAVELQHHTAVCLGDDRRRRPRLAAVRDADADRARRDKRHGNDRVGVGLPLADLDRLGSAGGAARQGH
jgi:hypothetical protein